MTGKKRRPYPPAVAVHRRYCQGHAGVRHGRPPWGRPGRVVACLPPFFCPYRLGTVVAPSTISPDIHEANPVMDPVDCKSVLIVEDDDLTRDALSIMLQEDGYHVLCAGNGQAALEQLQH